MNRIVLFLCIAILGGCVSIDSVAKRNLHKKFSKPLIVIPFEYRTRKIARNLKDELEEVFADNKMNVKVLTLQTEASKLELNSSSKDQETLNDEVYKNSRDLVNLFQAKRNLLRQWRHADSYLYIDCHGCLNWKRGLEGELQSTRRFWACLSSQEICQADFSKAESRPYPLTLLPLSPKASLKPA